jgi:hypothetical protein
MVAPIVLAFVLGCTHISPYNEMSYQFATSTKAEALNIISKATEPYSKHQAEVAALQLDMQKAYEYAHGLPKNEIISKMWMVVNSETEYSLGGFLQEWKTKSVLDEQYVAQKKIEIGEQFDQIIELESGKNKSAS